MTCHKGFAGGLNKRWGPASPAPNVDPNRPGPRPGPNLKLNPPLDRYAKCEGVGAGPPWARHCLCSCACPNDLACVPDEFANESALNGTASLLKMHSWSLNIPSFPVAQHVLL